MKKNKIILIVLIITIIMLTMGVTYAYIRSSSAQIGTNDISTLTCLSVSIDNVSNMIGNNNTISLTDAFPVSDLEGLTTNPYIFKIKNTCSSTYASVNINLESLNLDNESSLALNEIKVGFGDRNGKQRVWLLDNLYTQTSTITGSTSKRLKTVKLSPNEEKEYELRLWIDYDTTAEAMGKTYQGKIAIVATAIHESEVIPNTWENPASDSLLYAIKNDPKNVIKKGSRPGRDISSPLFADATAIGNQEVPTDLRSKYITYAEGYTDNGDNTITLTGVSTGIYSSVYSSLVNRYVVTSWIEDNFSDDSTPLITANIEQIVQVIAASASAMNFKVGMVSEPEAILGATTDDFGTSYYFRGAVENNYVVFANMCWRIVRVAGNNNIKLVLYNKNTSSVNNPCDHAYDNGGAAFATNQIKFNNASNHNAYIGYMYGNDAGETTYQETHENVNESNILKELKKWYNDKFLSSNGLKYAGKLSDTIWCNDKSINSGTGIGNSSTSYTMVNRNSAPSLICPDTGNDGLLSKFSATDEFGNGALNIDGIEYKIGLLTADELLYAGVTTYKENVLYYLWNNATYSYGWWTLTPCEYYNSSSNVFVLFSTSGYRRIIPYSSNSSAFYTRPAISLKNNVKIVSGGVGTSSNPYVIVA